MTKTEQTIDRSSSANGLRMSFRTTLSRSAPGKQQPTPIDNEKILSILSHTIIYLFNSKLSKNDQKSSL